MDERKKERKKKRKEKRKKDINLCYPLQVYKGTKKTRMNEVTKTKLGGSEQDKKEIILNRLLSRHERSHYRTYPEQQI
jgi:hypothetical protein